MASALRRSKEALQETDRRKDEFIDTLSHELRNPLAPIRTAAKIIAAPQSSPAQLQRIGSKQWRRDSIST